jgi:cytidylate kinase
MNVITISRQYGAGGREVAQRLAERLGWELLDRELLHQAAAVEHVPDAELEALDEKALGLVDRLRLHPPHERYMRGLKQAAQAAAARGSVILVGRGSRFLVGESPDVFRLRLVAPLAWRAERMAAREGWSSEEALARCVTVDRMRERFMRYFYGESAANPAAYDLVVDTARVPLEDLIDLVTTLLRGECGMEDVGPSRQPRVLTVSREMAAGDAALVPTLASRLGLRLFDREFMEEHARGLGVTDAEMRNLDDEPPGAGRRPGSRSFQPRYFDVLRQLVGEMAKEGDVLLVGRGGSGFLQDAPGAFHVRLTAPMSCRVRRVMEHHWLKEDAARKLLAESDDARQRFYQRAFSRDWTSPLEYHLTVNAGRLGTATVDLIALAAQRHWASLEEGAG